MSEPAGATSALVTVDQLVKHFELRGRGGHKIRAVDNISFCIADGETLGLVGESGSGKSTTGRLILHLIRPTSGEVRFEGASLADLSGQEMRRIRQQMQIIFQDPYGSLNPRMTVGRILAEGLEPLAIRSTREREAEISRLLELVGLRPSHRDRYPHEFSGGQRQRIGIARALAVKPRLLVADEPVSALDVSIQAQILNLLLELQQRLQLTMLFIAHDLAVVRHMSDRVAVMYRGKIVELADCDTIYRNPRHPYTQKLLEAIPVPDPSRRAIVNTSPEVDQTTDNSRDGCVFRPRCAYAQEICATEPPLRQIGGSHQSACHLAEELPPMVP